MKTRHLLIALAVAAAPAAAADPSPILDKSIAVKKDLLFSEGARHSLEAHPEP